MDFRIFKNERFFLALLIVIPLLVWSSSYTVIHYALSDFKPESLALMRFLVASSFLFIYGLFFKVKLPEIKDIPIILACGLIGISLYNVAVNIGRTTVTAGSTSMILNCYPIFVAILSACCLKECISKSKWAGFLISFIGIIFIGLGESNGFNLTSGIILILFAAVANSLYDVIQKHLLGKYSPLELTSYFIWSGTFFLLLFSGMLVQDLHSASISSILAVVYLGVFPSAIGYLLWSRFLSKSPANVAASILFVLPVLSIIIAFVFLKEIPATTSMIGGVIMLFGVFVINFYDQLKLQLKQSKPIYKWLIINKTELIHYRRSLKYNPASIHERISNLTRII